MASRAWDRRDLLWLAGIILLAGALRLAYVTQLRSSPDFAHPTMDAAYHDQWAEAIAQGEPFVDGPYFRAPFYPALLGTIYSVVGHSYVAPRLLQALLGTLSCGILYVIGRLVFTRAVAGAAGLVMAGYWVLIYYDGELLIPTLIVFLDLLLILSLLWAQRRPAVGRYAVVGVLLGLSAIARPNVLLFGPAIVAWLLWTQRRTGWRSLRSAAAVTAGCLVVVLPITIRNCAVGGDAVLIASQGGVNFYIGNNPDSDGRTAIVPGTPGDWWGGYYATIARAEQAAGRSLKPSEVSDYYYDQAWAFIRAEPGEATGLMVRKLRLFWSWWEFSNNKGIYFWTQEFTPWLRWLPVGFAIVGPLGLLGLALCWSRRAELFPLWGFVLVYMVSVVLFFCTARYRVPVLPVLILLAAHAVESIVRDGGARRWQRVAAQVAGVALAGLLVWTTPGTEAARDDSVDYAAVAQAYEKQGDRARAIEWYRRTLELRPNFLTAHYNLGTLLAQTGQLDAAITSLRQAVACEPALKAGETPARVANVHNNLATALAQTGALAEAIEHYQASIRLDPRATGGNAQLNLATLLAQQGRVAEARAVLEAALEVNPGQGQARLLLARLLTASGEAEAALGHVEQLCPQPPACDLVALDALSAALAVRGDYAEAARWAQVVLDQLTAQGSSADAAWVQQLRERLRAYQAGQPWQPGAPAQP